MLERIVRTSCSGLGGRWRGSLFFALSTTFLSLGGCGFFGDAADETDAKPSAAIQGESASLASAASPKNSRETYYVVYLNGAKVGHVHQFSRSDDGGKTIRTQQDTQLKLRRFGQVISQEMQLAVVESDAGNLLRLESEMQLGLTAKRVEGRVEGGSLVLDYPGQNNQPSRRIPWTAADGGFFAIERSIKSQPLRQGETRQLRQFSPVFDQICEIELVGGPRETTKLLDGEYELQRVEMQEKVPLAASAAIDQPPKVQAIVTTLWCDEQGTVVKTHADAMQQEMFLCDKSVALADFDPRQLDLGTGNVVRLDRRLQDMVAANRAVYGVHLKGGAADEVFVVEPRQQMETAVDGGTRLVVQRLDLADPAAVSAVTDAPTEADLLPSALIESNAPCIAELAALVAPEEPDAAKLAQELGREVDRRMAKKDFSQVFASAADACNSKQGDCTEHALLLAAVCRNRGIPARVAMGLVYIDSLQGFAYHMWTEVWIGDRWLGLDATRGGGEVTVGHLKLAHSTLQGTTAYGSFLPMLKVLGKLRLELLSEE